MLGFDEGSAVGVFVGSKVGLKDGRSVGVKPVSSMNRVNLDASQARKLNAWSARTWASSSETGAGCLEFIGASPSIQQPYTGW